LHLHAIEFPQNEIEILIFAIENPHSAFEFHPREFEIHIDAIDILLTEIEVPQFEIEFPFIKIDDLKTQFKSLILSYPALNFHIHH